MFLAEPQFGREMEVSAREPQENAPSSENCYSVDISALSSDGEALANAKFGLFSVKDGIESTKPEDTVTADENGMASMNVKQGKYVLRETKVPDKWALPDTAYYIEINESDGKTWTNPDDSSDCISYAENTVVTLYSDSSFTTALESAVFSSLAVTENTYTAGSNHFTFDIDSKGNVNAAYQNGTRVSDESFSRDFELIKCDTDTPIYTVKYHGNVVHPQNGCYLLDGADYLIEISEEDGSAKKTVRKRAEALDASEFYFRGTMLYHGEMTSSNQPLTKNSDSTYTYEGQKIEVTVTDNVTKKITSVRYVDEEADASVVDALSITSADYLVRYQDTTAKAVMNLNSRLLTDFRFVSDRAINVNVLDTDGEPLAGADVGVVEEVYSYDGASIHLFGKMPEDGETAKSIPSWKWDTTYTQSTINTGELELSLPYKVTASVKLKVYRVIETEAPDEYAIPSSDIVIIKGYADGKYVFYKRSIAHGKPIRDIPFEIICADSGYRLGDEKADTGEWEKINPDSEDDMVLNLVHNSGTCRICVAAVDQDANYINGVFLQIFKDGEEIPYIDNIRPDKTGAVTLGKAFAPGIYYIVEKEVPDHCSKDPEGVKQYFTVTEELDVSLGRAAFETGTGCDLDGAKQRYSVTDSHGNILTSHKDFDGTVGYANVKKIIAAMTEAPTYVGYKINLNAPTGSYVLDGKFSDEMCSFEYDDASKRATLTFKEAVDINNLLFAKDNGSFEVTDVKFIKEDIADPSEYDWITLDESSGANVISFTNKVIEVIVIDKKALGAKEIPEEAGKATFILKALENDADLKGLVVNGKEITESTETIKFECGKATFIGLDDGEYGLVEEIPPKGYTSVGDFTFVIKGGMIFGVEAVSCGRTYVDDTVVDSNGRPIGFRTIVIEDAPVVTIDTKVSNGKKISEALGCAEYTLTAMNENRDLTGVVIGEGEEALRVENGAKSVSFKGNSAKFTGLKDGKYKLVQDTASQGCLAVSEFTFEIKNGFVENVSAVTTGNVTVSEDGKILTVENVFIRALSANVIANSRVYDGTEKPLVTVTGEASGGTMNYALGTDCLNAPSEGWSIDIPAKTLIGTYYVWYKAVGDDNHRDTEPACVEVEIKPVDKKELNNAISDAENYYNGIKDETIYREVASALKTAIDDAKLIASESNVDKTTLDTSQATVVLAKEAAQAGKKEVDDTIAANKVTDVISRLPVGDQVAVADKVAIETAREVYEELTKDQKKKVSADVLKKLTDAENALEKAEKKAAEEKAQTEQLVKDKEEFAKEQTAVKDSAKSLAVAGDSEACGKLIEEAAKAMEALKYDENKDLDQNREALGAIFTKLKADLELQRAEEKKAAKETAKSAIENEAAKKEAQVAMNEQVTVIQKGNKFTVKWAKSASADGYDVYVGYSGKKAGEPAKIITNNTTTKTTITKIDGKKIDQKKIFRVYVVPYKIIDGKKVALGESTVSYLAGTKNAKFSNVRKITLKKSRYTVAAGKTAKIKAKVTLVDKNKKHLPKKYAARFRYKSSDESIATVDVNGKIKGIRQGTCTIYVYSVNGLVKKAMVTVR
jgi:hypothetical protein